MIAQLSQIILYVHNMESQVAFYKDLLGLPIEHPIDSQSFKNEDWVVFSTGDCKLALHSGGGKPSEQTASRVCFEVDNIQSSRELLSLKGIRVEEIYSPIPGVEVLNAVDPEGNLFALQTHS